MAAVVLTQYSIAFKAFASVMRYVRFKRAITLDDISRFVILFFTQGFSTLHAYFFILDAMHANVLTHGMLMSKRIAHVNSNPQAYVHRRKLYPSYVYENTIFNNRSLKAMDEDIFHLFCHLSFHIDQNFSRLASNHV